MGAPFLGDRKNGTGGPGPPVATYRELAPASALRGHVRAYFSFMPGAPAPPANRRLLREVRFALAESFCSPLIADGHASLALELGGLCEPGRGWTFAAPPRGSVVGPQRRAGTSVPGGCAEMVGAYFEPAVPTALLGAPAEALADRLVGLDLLWGWDGAKIVERIADLGEAARLDRLEAVLLERLGAASLSAPELDVAGLARWIRAHPAGASVRRLAQSAGVSRQHLTRRFRQAVGVSPKRYSRLARFHAGLAFAGSGRDSWAETAIALGYADQSHMIAEFREFSSLTPAALAAKRWFHPFILEAQARR